MSQVKIREHASASYGPRTWENAKKGDVTVAFAVDFETAGEKLTHRAAGERYTAIRIGRELMTAEHALSSARQLFSFLRQRDARCLNVAGNGIYTLSRHGLDQQMVNRFVASVVCKVHAHWNLGLIVSGGQTGVDIAGGVAGVLAEVPIELTLPKGYLQRHEDKVDRLHKHAEIEAQVIEGAVELKGNLLI
jgi:hypothetical protein